MRVREPFFELIVQLINRKSLTYCIKKMEKTEDMKDSDQYYCDICRGKKDAQKRQGKKIKFLLTFRTYINKVPKYLILQMKRFIYDSKTHQMVKTTDFVPFPNIIKVPVEKIDLFLVSRRYLSLQTQIDYCAPRDELELRSLHIAH